MPTADAPGRPDRAGDGRRETGDRGAFLARLQARLATGVPANPAHPVPPRPAEVPRPVSRLVDPDDLAATFERAATAVAAVVHRVDADHVPDDLLAHLVRTIGARSAVHTAEPEAVEVAGRMAGLGVAVAPLSIEAAAGADVGVTGATFAVAATGSVVLESADAGGRSAGLLPPTHLCIVAASRLVAMPGDVLRTLGTPGRLPSNLAFVTGPSRSGDIEQIITLGVHGPTAVHLVLLDRA